MNAACKKDIKGRKKSHYKECKGAKQSDACKERKKKCKKAADKYKDQKEDLEKLMKKKNKHMIASKRKCAPSELEAKNACAKKIISPGLSKV